MNPLAPIVLSLLSVAVAAASTPTKSTSPVPLKSAAPAPAKSTAPLSKYEREHLSLMRISAPADEYFGRLKMSFLGINNTLHDAGITAGDHTTDPSVVAKVAFAEDALKDWEKRYPRDPQLGRSYYLAISVEKKIWVQANQQQAWAYMNRIATVFPNTYFGKLIKREIAIGFTEHYYSVPVPCQTAAPTASPEPTAVPVPVATVTAAPRTNRGRPVASPSPTPTPAPTASPTPEPTPSPSPETMQIAKGLKAQVLTPPCVAPPTPTPVPTGTPAATPLPATASPQPPADSPSPSSASPQPSTSPRATAAPKPPR
ncbi:MAG TPA: hypothetical protein VGU66_18265 [Candidatus Elarobacter sp.]|nr:hypothetical protein [Candidatus Elarobacter sp.]